MNSFSGYLGLPNITSITADDLDLANLTVDTITVNTQANIDSIQPLTNTSSITVGTNTNTGIIDFQQDVDVNADLEANNITTTGTLYTDNIQPLLSNSNLVIGTTTNTGILDVRQSATFSTNKNLTLQGTGLITTPNLTNTTANITTNNSTNLNTNNLQPITNANAVNCFTNADLTINIGKYGNTNLITLNQSTLLQTNSNLTLAGTGRIITPNLRVTSLSANKIVLSNANDDLVSSTWGESDLVILSANNAFTGNNTFSTFQTFNGNLLCNTFRGTTAGSAISLFSTTTAGITLGGASSGITLSDNVSLPANKTITLNTTGGRILSNVYTGTTTSSAMTFGEFGDTNNVTFYKNINMGATRFITLQSDGTLYVNTITATDASAAVNMFDNQTGSINLGYTVSSNPINLNCNTTLATNKNLTLQGTGKITTPNILVSGLSASKLVLTDASKNIVSSSWGESDLVILSANNTLIGTNTFSTTTTFNGNLLGNTFRGTAVGNAITLFTTTTAGITLGGASSGISLADNTSLSVNKNLTLSGTGKITTPNILVSGLTASKMVLTDASNNLISSLYTDTDFARLAASNVFSGTTNTFNNTLLVNTITGTTAGSAISLFGTSTALIDLGNNASTSTIRLNQNTSLASGKILRTPYLYAISSVDNIYIGNHSTDSGTLFVELNMDLRSTKQLKLNNLTASKLVLSDANKNLISSSYTDTDFVLKTGSSISGTLNVNDIQGTTSSSNINLFTNTSGVSSQINIGNSTNLGVYIAGNTTIQNNGVLSVNNIYSNSASDLILTTLTAGFFVKVNQDLKMDTGKALTAERISGLSSTATLNVGYNNGETGIISLNRNTEVPVGRTLKCENYQSNTATTNLSIGSTNTTSSITAGGALTSGNINLSNTSATGKINLNANVVVGTGKDLTMSSTGYIYGNNWLSLASSSNMSIGLSLSSGSLLIGDSSSVTPFTGGTQNNSFFAVRRHLNTARFGYTNLGYGNATTPTLFKSSILSGKYLTSTLFAGANTDEWCSFESDTEGEGSAFLQNGNTQILVNAGDAGGFPLFWFDEDTLAASPAGSTSYAWTGWKISTGGAFTTASSRKIKRDIKPIIKDGLLDKLENVEFVNYKMKPPKEGMLYKNGVEREKYKRVHMGCIAEDVKVLFPECVERENADAVWMLNYTDLNLYFNKGVQELIKQNKEQQATINTQQTQINDLTTRLARLEQLILNP